MIKMLKRYDDSPVSAIFYDHICPVANRDERYVAVSETGYDLPQFVPAVGKNEGIRYAADSD
jgi:hypothetical protein